MRKSINKDLRINIRILLSMKKVKEGMKMKMKKNFLNNLNKKYYHNIKIVCISIIMITKTKKVNINLQI